MKQISILIIISVSLLFFSACSLFPKNSKDNSVIGAVAPSSSYLAEAITSQVMFSHTPKRILEVGAGTGVFTRELIKKLGPGDHLDIVEITPEFCEMLSEEFGSNKLVTLYCGDILAWQPSEKYDYIVSGLPFNSFPHDFVKKIINQYKLLSRQGTIVSFFEYSAVKAYRYVADWDNERIASRSAINLFIAENEMFREHVFLNFPPAIVYFLRML